MTNGFEVNKLEKEECTNPEMLAKGIVAFQICRFVIDFYGSKTVSELDTKIMDDGRQIVIDGCGFIPAGYEL